MLFEWLQVVLAKPLCARQHQTGQSTGSMPSERACLLFSCNQAYTHTCVDVWSVTCASSTAVLICFDQKRNMHLNFSKGPPLPAAGLLNAAFTFATGKLCEAFILDALQLWPTVTLCHTGML